MAKVINLFSRQLQQKNTPVLRPAHFELLSTPSEVTTYKMLQATEDFNFRNVWAVTLASYKSLGLNLKELEKHEATIIEIEKAVRIAGLVKHDVEAEEFFVNLLSKMREHNLVVSSLKSIPKEFRGYVWNLDFQIIINGGAYAEGLARRIIGRPLVRHIYF